MTRVPYEPARVRPLRKLLWVVVSFGVVMVMFAVFFLAVDARPGEVLGTLLIPGILLTWLSGWSIGLLSRGEALARVTVPATGAVAILVGVLLSGIGVGLLIGVFGVLLLLYALLPIRDPEPDPPTDG